MIKKLAAAFLCFVILAGCTPKKGPSGTTDAGHTDNTATTTAEAPSKSTDGSRSTTSSQTSGQQTPQELGDIADIDLSVIPDMVLEHIFVYSDDLVFLFMVPVTETGWSEDVTLFRCSLKDKKPDPDGLRLGTVGQFPDRVYSDGTFSVVIQDPEAYTYEKLLFIDPYTMTASEEELPDGELILLRLSPDKKYRALTFYDRAELYENGELIYTQARDEGDPDEVTDDKMPIFSGFTSDGKTLLIELMGWEWVYYSSIYDIAGKRLTDFEDAAGAQIFSVGNDYMLAEPYSMLPIGFIDRVSLEITEVSVSKNLGEYGRSFGLSDLSAAFSVGEEILTLVVMNIHGTVTYTIQLPETIRCDQTELSPSGRTAVIYTRRTVSTPDRVSVIVLS